MQWPRYSNPMNFYRALGSGLFPLVDFHRISNWVYTLLILTVVYTRRSTPSTSVGTRGYVTREVHRQRRVDLATLSPASVRFGVWLVLLDRRNDRWNFIKSSSNFYCYDLIYSCAHSGERGLLEPTHNSVLGTVSVRRLEQR